MSKRDDALRAYETALMLGEGLEAAAALMAAELRPKAKSVEERDLYAPVKIGKRAKFNGAFVVDWQDGSQTLVTGVCYDKPVDAHAAAFQAANRLRRTRARHAWAKLPEAPSRYLDRGGLKRETPEFWSFVWARELPAPVAVREA